MYVTEAIDEFLTYIAVERGLSVYTVRNYTKALHLFLTSAYGKETDLPVSEIQPSHIRTHVRYLNELSLRPKTIHLNLCAIRSFTKFLMTYDYISLDPCSKIPRIKLPTTKPNPLRDDEIKRFFEAIDQSTIDERRNYVLFQLALNTGLRAAELLALTIHDINLSEALLYVRHGKGDKDLLVPLSSSLCTVLGDYLSNIRPKLVKDASLNALFVTTTQQPLWSSSIRIFAQKYAKKAGLTYRQVSSHTFRYTYATLLARKSKADITVIIELLGHANIQTTARYVGVVEEDKRRAVEALDL